MRSIMPRIAVNALILALILLFSIAVVFSSGVAANGKDDTGATEVIIIKSPGCTKCAAAERALEKIGLDVPINVTGYYYYSEDGHRIIKQYRAKDVPAIIIGMQVINYRDYEGDNDLLESLIKGALANQTLPILRLHSPCPAMRAQSRASARLPMARA